MKFGMKVPVDIFFGEMSEVSAKICESFGGRDAFLSFLSDSVDNVELGVVYSVTEPSFVLSAAKLCSRYGLNITIHGSLNEASCPEEFFAPYIQLFESKLQPFYNITVHPFESPVETEDFLRKICSCIDENSYPVRITLENQRFKKEGNKETLCRHVAEVVGRIGSPHLYNCFDFGHQLSNIRKYGDDCDEAVPEFLSLVKHTHIHSLFEGSTHFPLDCGEVLLEKNITELEKRGFDGVYLLELAPGRYIDRFDIKKAAEISVSVLKTAAYQVKAKLNTVEKILNKYSELVKKQFLSWTEKGAGLRYLVLRCIY